MDLEDHFYIETQVKHGFSGQVTDEVLFVKPTRALRAVSFQQHVSQIILRWKRTPISFEARNDRRLLHGKCAAKWGVFQFDFWGYPGCSCSSTKRSALRFDPEHRNHCDDPQAEALESFCFRLSKLHAELPVYWQHCHVNPTIDRFEVRGPTVHVL